MLLFCNNIQIVVYIIEIYLYNIYIYILIVVNPFNLCLKSYLSKRLFLSQNNYN